MRRRIASVAVVIAAGAALAAGCGSSSSSSSSSSGGSGGGGGSSKGPIKILTYGDITGLAPTPEHQFLDGVKAAVNAFNAAGGVQGRKVDLISCDTQLNPAQAASCVTKAKSEGVVAAIPSLELLDNVTTPILEKLGIPIIGTNPSTAAAQFSKTSACYLNGPYILYPDAARALAKAGAKSISFMEPAGVANEDTLAKAANAAAASQGAKVPAFIGVAPTATNFSAIAAKALSSGEDGVYVSATAPGLFSLVGALGQSKPGLKMGGPGYNIVDTKILGAFTKIPPAKGMYVNNYTAFPTDSSVPGIKLFQQQIATVDKTDVGSETALFTWVDAWGGMQILKSMTSGSITSSTILAAMKTAHLSFQGVVPDWSYQYNTLGLGCVTSNSVYQGVYKGGVSITPLNGDKPVTGLTPDIIALYKKDLASYAQ
jgi:ABC-type branched-subunit amino acid transport system substrate-binding protein